MIGKSQIPNSKSQINSNIQYSKFQAKRFQSLVIWLLVIIWNLVLGAWNLAAYAKEITILYTGNTHAMLYPCHCPIEPDGGLARRAAFVKGLRRNNPRLLLLDTGNSFAGGLSDVNTQNTQLDMQRSQISLKAMELMQYDASGIGEDEFNFGADFLRNKIKESTVPFLSTNISPLAGLAGAKPYLIKEIDGVKIAIIGLTSLSAARKAEGFKFTELKTAIESAVAESKKEGADLVIILSSLNTGDDIELIKQVSQVDILITGQQKQKEEVSLKINSTIIVKPSWQGRRIGKLSIDLTNKQISGYKAEEFRLSDKITPDAKILSILPQCFSDNDCRKEDSIGTCQNPAAISSRCLVTELSKVKLTVITSNECLACDWKPAINFLKAQFPGLKISYLYYPESKAKKIVKDFGIKGLPAYLLGKEAEKEKGFQRLKDNLEARGDFYLLKPQAGGLSYIVGRQKISGKLDLFISLYDSASPQLLKMIKEFNPVVHLLAIENNAKFEASKGNLEAEEYLRASCVQKYYPQEFWDYISCRANSLNSSWWEDCLSGLDTEKIKLCARSDEGKTLLRENISLNKELGIMFGPTYLLDNQQIFGTEGVPPKEEFRKLLKK